MNGRLTAAGWQDASAELDAVSARLAAHQPATHAQLRTRVRAFAGRTPGDPLRLEDLAVHAIVLLLLGAVSANVATLIFARTAMRESEMVVRHALGASRARVIAQIVTEGLVLALAAGVVGLVVARTTVRYAWARASQIIGSRTLSPSERSSPSSRSRWSSAALSSAAFWSRRWFSPLPGCTRSWPLPWRVAPARSVSAARSGANLRHVVGSVFARAGRQLGGGIIAGNSLILFLAWRADSLTADLLVSSVITSVIMVAVGVLACAAPARRALRVAPSEALRQG